MSRSEVTRLRHQIAAEIEAMNLSLYGYAAVAQHHIIEQKYTQLGIYQEQLTALVGPMEAAHLLIEELNQRISDGPLLFQTNRLIDESHK